jgi:hypothetical protein
MGPPACAHCGRPVRGTAFVNDDPLCHPDDGMDCYRLATVYGHPLPCPPCRAGRPDAMTTTAPFR